MATQQQIDEARRLSSSGQVSGNESTATIQRKLADGVIMTPDRPSSDYGSYVPQADERVGGGSLQTAEALVFMWQAFGLTRLFGLLGRLVWWLLRNSLFIAAGLVLVVMLIGLVPIVSFGRPMTREVLFGLAVGTVGAICLVTLGQLIRLVARALTKSTRGPSTAGRGHRR